MSKKKSPKRYIYENGHLIVKNIENESNHLEQNIFEDNSKFNNNININIEFPLLSNKNNNSNNIYRIFSTQIDENNVNENKNEESSKNKSLSEDKNKEDIINKDKDFNFRSIETNQPVSRNPRLLRKLNQSKLSSDIQKMCQYLYTSPRKNTKENIKFKIIEKESEYIKTLKKNYLVDEDLINNYKYRNRIIKTKNNQSNQNIIKSNKNINNNILSDNEVIKKYYDQNRNTIDINKLTRYRFENYSRIIPKYKHPQLYELKIANKEEDNDIKLPPIKIDNKTPIELTEFIPIKKGISKEEQRNEYLHYKIMRSYRLEGFHI